MISVSFTNILWAAAVIFYLGVILNLIRKDKNSGLNRVWCICQLNGLSALVPRDVYDRASRDFWERHRALAMSGDLIAPPADQIITVRTGSPAFQLLIDGVKLEKRLFYIPTERPLSLNMFETYPRIHGHSWDGRYPDLLERLAKKATR